MKRLSKWFKKSDKFDLIGYVLLICFSAYMFTYLYNNVALITDSDQSSNLIYAKMLLEEGKIISENWYYSTYVDLINMDKFQAFFFLFTDNWLFVHWLTNITVEILLFLSFFYVCKQLDIKHIPWLSFLIVGCVDYMYYKFAYSFNIYALYMAMGLLSFGLIVNAVRSEKPFPFYCLFAIAVFLFSTSGIRNITTIYAPVIATVIIVMIFNKIGLCVTDSKVTNRLIIVSFITIAGSLLGYAFNKFVLCALAGYSSTPLGITTRLLKQFPTIFKDVILGWLSLFGIGEMDVITVFFCVLLFFLIVWCIYIFVKSDCSNLFDQMAIIYFIISACAISATFFISTSFSFESRYLFQSYAFLIVMLGCMVSRIDIKPAYIICVLAALSVVIRTNEYKNMEISSSKNQELIQICEILKDKGVNQGYADFWNGNVITELTNGEVEVWAFKDNDSIENAILTKSYENFEKGDYDGFIYEWLQKKKHVDTSFKDSFFFIVEEAFEHNFTEEAIKKYAVYNGERRKLLIFDNYQQLSELFASK